MDMMLSCLQEELRDLPRAIEEADRAYGAQVDAAVSAMLESERRRILFLAGPSGSGKTTTANLLRDRLIAAGREAEVVSLDHFYRPTDAPDYPRHADGTPDFEAPDALDIGAIRTALSTVLSGGTYPLPYFDFRAGKRAEKSTPLFLRPHGCLIVEGLHALNPRLSEGILHEDCYFVFISVSQNILLPSGARLLSGRKMRFVRRMVRDSIYRNATAARTYELWQGVLRGEDAFLYPFRDRADMAINSFHTYELGLLRPDAEALLEAEDAPHTPYTAAVRETLSHFAPVPKDLVPDTSLLREFISGGVYEHVY